MKLLLFIAILLSTFGHAYERPHAPPKAIVTIVDRIANEPSLSMFTDALQADDMIYLLNNQGPFTVFAPTNEALRNKLPIRMYQDLMKPENKRDLRTFLTYYIVHEVIAPENIRSLKTINGHPLNVSLINGEFVINYARVLAHYQESNGIVYIIDGSLVPPGDWPLILLKSIH